MRKSETLDTDHEVIDEELSEARERVVAYLYRCPFCGHSPCDMSPEEFADKMGAASVYSAAVAREEANRLMCELLRKLGYGGGVRIFENLIM